MKKKKIPKFKTEEEEARFWETHSLTDYVDELEEVELEWVPEEDTCPKCGASMEGETVDIELDDGLCIRNVHRYHCPVCGAFKLSPKSLQKINKLDLELKRYGLLGIMLQEELAKSDSKSSA